MVPIIMTERSGFPQQSRFLYCGHEIKLASFRKFFVRAIPPRLPLHPPNLSIFSGVNIVRLFCLIVELMILYINCTLLRYLVSLIALLYAIYKRIRTQQEL